MITRRYRAKTLDTGRVVEGFYVEYPETTYCHPAKVVGEIMGLVGKQYRKREGEVKSLVSCLTKEHYEELMNSEVCSTFTSYAKELLEDTDIYQ